jgi:tight adherence protein C
MICFMAGWFAAMPMRERRVETEKKLSSAGDFMGLSSDELHAMALLTMIFGTFASALIFYISNVPLLALVFVALICWYMPFSHVETVGDDRKRNINRDLPTTVEMISLGMSAGLDFPGALRRVSEAQIAGSSIRDEMQRILRDLELGHTRARALRSFAARVPTDEVSDFVAAVVQAEAKGNPLREVLHIQAGMLRMRRSIRAEEIASRSSLLLVMPLGLLLISLLLMIAGPLMITVMETM